MQGLVMCFALCCAFAASASAQEVDFCNATARVEGISPRLVLRARMGFTPHGMFLMSDHCPQRAPAAVVLNPHDPGAPEVPFGVSHDALVRVKPFLRLTGGSSTACGVISGMLTVKKNFKLKQMGGGPQGNGFGPRGAYKFAFILESVIEIGPCS